MPNKKLKLISFQPLSSEENYDDLSSLFKIGSSLKNIDDVVLDMSGTNFLIPSRAINLVLAWVRGLTSHPHLHILQRI